MDWLNIFWFVLACIILVQSCGYLVRALANLSPYLGLNEFSVGSIILAMSSSFPDLFVGITSAFKKIPELSLGNVIGANIMDMTIVIGIVTLLGRGIRMRSRIVRRNVFYLMLVVLLPILLMLDQELSRIDGIILTALYCVYLWLLVKQEKSFRKEIKRGSGREALWNLIAAGVITALMLFSAYLIVHFGKLISADLNLPLIFVGIFLVAFGTSLPELVFESRAVLTRHEDMALGDMMGCVITKSTLVLGVTAMIHPITTNFLLFFTSAIFMVIVAFIFLTFAESDYGLDWKEGISLIILYIFFFIVESYIKSMQGGV